ncbi:MAG: integrating conjugative element protein [Tatlockia sp.]|nr:integrating conjugative element protein [Tatlockia sp.]
MKKIMLLMLLIPAVNASILPTQSEYYYQLGGASDVFIPPVNQDHTVTLGGRINTSGLLNCNLFNPVLSLTNSLNGLKDSVMGMPTEIIDNLKGGVIGYPLYKLQTSMPPLYNMLQNNTFSLLNEFSLKAKDCQEVKKALDEGNSPINSMLSVSDSQGWIEAATRAKNKQSVDIIHDSKVIATKGDEYGIPWVGRTNGNAGGTKQNPIRIINDVVIAGYNLLLKPSRNLDNKSQPSLEAANASSFVRFWSTPEKAGDWAVLVLGDLQVSAKNDASSKGISAGIGLSPLLQSCPKIASSTTCVTNVAGFLWQLIEKKNPLEAELRKISAGNVLITEDIITAIVRMPREQQILTVSKLSEEIALQNLMEEAMAMRRLMQAGLQIQEVQNLKPAQKMVQRAISELDKDIHGLAFESEVRKKMMTDTLSLIMDLRTHELAKSLPSDEHEKALIKNGAIYRSSEKKGG